MKVAPEFVRPAITSLYEVAGRFLLVDVFDQQTSEAVQRFLERWNIALVSNDNPEDVHAKLIIRCTELPLVPTEFEEFILSDEATGYACDTSYQVVFDEAIIAADESNVVTVSVTKPLDAKDKILPQLISHAISAALRRCGVFELHSAAVINKATAKSVLICGPSGSGKSTLTLQLASSGWSYVSDDVVLLSMIGEKVKAIGFRRFFALTQQTVAEGGVPEITALFADGPETNGKKQILPQDFFPAGLESDCWPNVLFFPMITEEPVSRMQRLSPAETMSRLIRLCPWSCYDRAIARSFLDTLARLVRQSANYDLFAGTDLMGDPDYTASYLSSTR